MLVAHFKKQTSQILPIAQLISRGLNLTYIYFKKQQKNFISNCYKRETELAYVIGVQTGVAFESFLTHQRVAVE